MGFGVPAQPVNGEEPHRSLAVYLARHNAGNNSIALTATLLALGFAFYAMDALPFACAAALPVFALLLAANKRLRVTGNGICHKQTRIIALLGAGVWCLTLLIGFAIALYRPASFNYPLIYTFTTPDFSLYANLAKGLAGYLIVIWLYSSAPIHNRLSPLRSTLAVSAGVISVLIVAVLGFDIGWHPKLPSGVIGFALINLVITVTAEEAFFRLLIQDGLHKLLPKKLQATPQAALWLAAGASAFIFALAHAPITHPTFLLFLCAGGIYALAYQLTGRLSVAIATHFGVNVFHFLLLQYPLVL